MTTPNTTESMGSRDLCTPLYFGVNDKTRPWLYFGGPPRTPAQQNAHPIRKVEYGGGMKPLDTTIYDARTNPPLSSVRPETAGQPATLDDCSFELDTSGWHPSLTTEDYYLLDKNPDLKETLYTEVAAYLEQKLGATAVGVFHHQVRNEAKVGELGNGTATGTVAGYAHTAPHTDTSALSGDEAYLGIVQTHPRLKEYAGKGRYLYLNMWRNISSEATVRNNHLAVMDERSAVKPDDYIEKDLFMPGPVHIVQYHLNARHHHLHRWYYFPDMAFDESLLFKQWDSDHTKPARCCFHVAVKDASAPADAPTRESIELRCIAVFADAEPTTVPTAELISQAMINHNEGLPEGVSVDSGAGGGLWSGLRSLFGRLTGLGGGSEADPGDDKIPVFVKKLTMAVDSISLWPKEGLDWGRGNFADGKDFDQGLETFTAGLVQDIKGHFNLRGKSKGFQKKVAEQAVKDEEYRSTVLKSIVAGA